MDNYGYTCKCVDVYGLVSTRLDAFGCVRVFSFLSRTVIRLESQSAWTLSVQWTIQISQFYCFTGLHKYSLECYSVKVLECYNIRLHSAPLVQSHYVTLLQCCIVTCNLVSSWYCYNITKQSWPFNVLQCLNWHLTMFEWLS